MVDSIQNSNRQLSRVAKPWHQQWWFFVGLGTVVLITVLAVVLVRVLTSPAGGNLGQFTFAPGTLAPDPAVSAEVVSSDDPSLGNPQAAVVLVEFGDFECPFCKQAAPVIRTLMAEYQDRVFFIYRDFPLVSVHPVAIAAAEASMCLWEQGKDIFWSFHDRAFQNQALLSESMMEQWATQAGADTPSFQRCVSDRRFQEEVELDLAAGINAGVRGTPTFFLNGRKIEGVLPLDTWRALLERAIADAS